MPKQGWKFQLQLTSANTKTTFCNKRNTQNSIFFINMEMSRYENSD
jgi:hypothetical protein